MPQASDEIRAPWHNEEAGYDDGAWKLLQSKGWIEQKFTLRHPYDDPEKISEDEWGAVQYLIDEWDWDYEGTPRGVLAHG